jgi:beta-lactam-binding protein with PASTA domain
MYVFDESAVGTIIEQDPAPDSEIVGMTILDFVVSRGPDVDTFSLPSFVGLSWSDAMIILARDDVPFRFKLEEQPTIGQEGVVVAQTPEPGTEVVVGTPVELSIRAMRDVPDDRVFGIFDRTLPEYAVPVELRAEVIDPDGESSTLFEMIHPGGRIVFPYLLPAGSNIVLYRYDVEVIRLPIRQDEE